MCTRFHLLTVVLRDRPRPLFAAALQSLFLVTARCERALAVLLLEGGYRRGGCQRVALVVRLGIEFVVVSSDAFGVHQVSFVGYYGVGFDGASATHIHVVRVLLHVDRSSGLEACSGRARGALGELADTASELLHVGLAGWAGQRGGWQQLGDGVAHVEEVVGEQLIEGGALGGVGLQDTCDQGARLVRYLHMLREALGVHADSTLGGLDVVGLEGRLTHQEGVDDDAQRPHVDLLRVAILALQYLRCNLVWRAAYGPLALAIELQFGRQPEVPNLDLHVVGEEEVAELEVTMDHAVAVQLPEGSHDLDGLALHFQFGQPFAPAQQVIHRLICAKL